MIKRITNFLSNQKTLKKILYFFPVQLIFVHVKNNPILFVIWTVLVATISKSILIKYGVPYLFLTPEYMGEVSVLSYFILGFSFGGFIMSFNISSYIVNGHRFPFIATLSRPFYKYYLNNISWGGSLIIIYLYFATQQLLLDGNSTGEIFLYLLGFIGGILLISLLTIGYFINTNKDFIKLFGALPTRKEGSNVVGAVFHKRIKADSFFNRDRERNVETYLSSPIKIGIARSTDHYDSTMLKKVFQQNHFNAALFEITAIFSIILLTFGSEYEYFNIPAGASITLMFTIFIMITSAVHSWFRGWASGVLILLLLLFNYFSQYPAFNTPNKAYGLNYDIEKVIYSKENIEKDITQKNYRKDYIHTLQILENWRKRNTSSGFKKGEKPKMVFINTSGGGMRSSLWSMFSIQQTDSILQGKLLDRTQLITGSSGGMVGMSYLRELLLKKRKGEIANIYDRKLTENLSKDILNKVGFMLCVNDMIFKFRKFKDGNNEYVMDRGYAFEDQLNSNTGGILNKRIKDYYQPEFDAQIPMSIISPTIVSDGRRLLISPQPISYLSYTFPEKNIRNNVLLESIEFGRFFKNQNADSLKFLTALRMSSTFPYIMPIVTLPTKPTIDVMDSGLRDNFGSKTSLKFLYTFKDWIEAHTSGVIILQIRDSEKKAPPVSHETTFIKSISSPVDNIYKNMFITQDYEHDQLIQYASEWFDGTIDIIDFAVENSEDKQLSLSWHLTESEKKQIYHSIHSKENQESLERLKSLIR